MAESKRAPRRQPTQSRSQATVDAIVEAADRIIRANNVAALSMREVARVAGVSNGTLYQYFASQEALLAAWEERALTELMQRSATLFGQILENPPPWEYAIVRIVYLGVGL